MNFLYPGFLFGLFAVAIPVIIHLFNFRKFKKIYFSNVQFLESVKAQHSSRERLKNLLILSARVLVIAFLVFAFARPYIVNHRAVAPNAVQLVTMYIDNSYSMETVNKEGGLLENAKRSALSIAKGFGVNARFQLITNDFEGRHQRPMSFEEFKSAVEEVKISAASRSLPQVIQRQQSDLGTTATQYFYILSDFQKTFSGSDPIIIDTNLRLSLIKLNASNLPNVSVDSTWFLSPVHQPGAAEQLVVRLRNYGEVTAGNIPLKLTINDRQVGVSRMTILAGKSKTDTLRFSGLSEGWKKGIISIKDYPLTFDDELNFSFKVNSGLRILAINGKPEKNYLGALFGTDRYFQLDMMSEANIDYSVFSKYQLVILNEIRSPSSGLSQQLTKYVKNGGTAVIFPDLRAEKDAYGTFLSESGLPAVIGLVTEDSRVTSIDLQNPLFKGLFTEVPKNIDLPLVSQFLTFSGSGDGGTLLSLPANRPFLMKYGKGKGSIFLFSVGLNERDGNLPMHPIFVPIMLKIAFSGVAESPLNYIAGKDNLLKAPYIPAGQNQVVTLRANKFEIIPELSTQNGESQLYIADQIRKAGFYDLMKTDSLMSVYAFNTAGDESEIKFSSVKDLNNIFGKQPVTIVDAQSDSLPVSDIIQNDGKELWKICLILSALFLALEILLIKFFNRKSLSHNETSY